MSFLPDIDEDGKLKELPPEPVLFTPKRRHVGVNPDTELVRKDRFGTHLKDAPTMKNIHECEPDIHDKCFICGRPMMV